MLCVWAKAHIADLRWDMCVYNPDKDIHVSGSIVRSGNWEGSLVTQMISAMRANPNSMLLDIGGNIGYYTLAAAKAGFHVDVFEPVPLNAAMMQASLAQNHFTDVNLHTCALTDSMTQLHMGTHTINQGGVAHAKQKSNATSYGMTEQMYTTLLPALTFDSIMTPEKRPVYVKIDIEGGECSAFKGMHKFFAETDKFIGLNMEFGQVARGCCADWMQPGGVFDTLHRKHNLCPRGISFVNVCNTNTWDLLWEFCAKPTTRSRLFMRRRVRVENVG